MKVISLGAGVQSSTLYLLSSLNILPRADVALFADTGAEPQSVYDYLEYLKGLSGRYGIPIETVSAGNIEEDLLSNDGDRFASIPFFMKNKDDTSGMARRQCTAEYKLRPVMKRTRELLKERGEKQAEMWIGISLDETQRMKPARVKYIQNYWPLIYDMKWKRSDCLEWYRKNDFKEPPRSACVFCPFHNDGEWQRIKDDKPSWERVIAVDKAIRKMVRFDNEAYLHREMKPIDEIQFGGDPDQLDMFGNECEGFCGI